eukprot:gene10364-biopygen378
MHPNMDPRACRGHSAGSRPASRLRACGRRVALLLLPHDDVVVAPRDTRPEGIFSDPVPQSRLAMQKGPNGEDPRKSPGLF